MTKRIEFFYDVISPTAYLAWAQLPAIAKRTGAAIDHRPMFLGAVMKMAGNQPPGTVKAKGAWMQQDLQRFARRHGVPFKMNPHFPMIDTRPVLNVAIAWRDRPDFAAYLDAVFAMMWRDGVNVGDREALNGALVAAGIDTETFWLAAEDPANKQTLRDNTEEATKRGAFGAPTFFVGDEMHFGQDRLDWVEEAVRA